MADKSSTITSQGHAGLDEGGLGRPNLNTTRNFEKPTKALPRDKSAQA